MESKKILECGVTPETVLELLDLADKVHNRVKASVTVSVSYNDVSVHICCFFGSNDFLIYEYTGVGYLRDIGGRTFDDAEFTAARAYMTTLLKRAETEEEIRREDDIV